MRRGQRRKYLIMLGACALARCGFDGRSDRCRVMAGPICQLKDHYTEFSRRIEHQPRVRRQAAVRRRRYGNRRGSRRIW